MKQPSKIFGTDGVRGKANHYPMTVEVALALGRAAGKLFRTNKTKHKVVIGKDTRLSCYMFENALISGLCSMGVDTLMLGPFPTPGVAFMTRAYRADAGVVISASHNEFSDNGIKFFSADGFKLPDEWEREMERLVHENHFNDCLPSDAEIGRNSKVHDADGRYIEYIKASFPKKSSLKGMTIALDCANGAGYKVAPLVFRELDATVHVYGNNPNGLNINERCGSLHPGDIQKAVIDHKADVGIALDGDADRVVLVDEKARIVDGDTILAICARDMKRHQQLLNNVVVATVMSNYGFFKTMEELDIQVVKSPVGDRYVLQEMLKSGAVLGGEQSGHTIFLDYSTTGDGILCALQVLKIMKETGSKLSDLAAFVQKYPQACINVKVSEKRPLDQSRPITDAITKAEKQLAGVGRVLVRYSGTEPICRVMVEGPKLKAVQDMAAEIAAVIENEIGIKK